jgi:Flp pilus assembly protein TadG
MKRLRRKLPARERGSVAVECAIVIPIFLFMLSGMLFFGRLFWHYTVIQKAAHDAARFLATAPLRDMMAANGADVPLALVASKIASDEIAELNPGDSKCYGDKVPQKILARVKLQVTDPFLDAYTAEFTDGNPIQIEAVMATDWVGN